MSAWRHKTIVGIVAALGFLLGAGYASIHPSMLTARTPGRAAAGHTEHGHGGRGRGQRSGPETAR